MTVQQHLKIDDPTGALLNTTSATAPSGVRVPPFRRIVWLVPAAYALHIIEESVGNFPAWVTDDVHGSFSSTAFVMNNVVFMTVMLANVTLNHHRTTPRRATVLLVLTSANLFWDGLFHLLSTPVLDVYSPGLITSALLYFPVCLLLGTAVVTQGVLPVRRLVQAAIGGLAAFGFIVWYGLFNFTV